MIHVFKLQMILKYKYPRIYSLYQQEQLLSEYILKSYSLSPKSFMSY